MLALRAYLLLPLAAVGAVATTMNRSVGPPTWKLAQLLVNPPGSAFGGMAYDPPLEELVLYVGASGSKGAGQTWLWGQESWKQSASTSSPPPRYSTSFTCGSTGSCLLFSGFAEAGDTWIWTAGKWLRPRLKVQPVRRFDAAIAFDIASNQALLFGGFATSGSVNGPRNDTWTWDGSNWRELRLALRPSARIGPALAWDGASREFILFGGMNSRGYLGDTWILKGNSWRRVTTSVSPTPRYRAAMAYDPRLGGVVLFGGDNGDLLGDTWLWKGSKWRRLYVGQGPSPRDGASLAFDPRSSSLVLFGGETSAADSRQTWLFR